MADTSTPFDKERQSGHSTAPHILPLGNRANLLPDCSTLMFLRDFARSYTVVSALPPTLSSFIAN